MKPHNRAHFQFCKFIYEEGYSIWIRYQGKRSQSCVSIPLWTKALFFTRWGRNRSRSKRTIFLICAESTKNVSAASIVMESCISSSQALIICFGFTKQFVKQQHLAGNTSLAQTINKAYHHSIEYNTRRIITKTWNITNYMYQTQINPSTNKLKNNQNFTRHT